MSRPKRNQPKDNGNSSFDFLGFTHYLGKSRKGNWVLKKKTRSGKVKAFLRNIKDYCKRNRHRPLEEQQAKISQKLRGHYNYFGVRFNYRVLGSVYDKTKKCDTCLPYSPWITGPGAVRWRHSSQHSTDQGLTYQKQ